MHDGPMIGGFPQCVACAGAGSFQPTREGLFCKWRGSLRGGFAGDNSVGGIGLSSVAHAGADSFHRTSEWIFCQ